MSQNINTFLSHLLKPVMRRLAFGALLLVLGTGAFGQTVSFQNLKQAAQDGNVSAQLQLGRLYNQGQGVPQNFELARKWMTLAAEAGNPEAQNQLGRYLRSGLGGPVDLGQAFEWLEKAARSNTPDYVFDLATMFEQGAGVPQDHTKAASLYEAAAKDGLIEAAVSLGVMYQNGLGVEQDYARALALYRPAADAGHARAQNNLGLLYTRGTGVAQNYEEAAKWFSKAAQAGLPEAMGNLGVLYENGFGVAQSDETAAELYRQSGQNAAQSLQAIPYLFNAYLTLPENTPATIKQLRSQADQGDPIAQFILGYLLITGPDTAQDAPQAAYWFEQAAQAGIGNAMANLGLMYHRGAGVPQDYVVGQMWLTLGARSKSPELIYLRDRFLSRMTGTQIIEAQEMAQKKWETGRK